MHDLYVSSDKLKFDDYREVRKKYSKQNNVVDIGIVNTSFHQLNYNPNDNSKGGLQLNNGIFEKINDKKAFIQHNVLIIAPLKKYAIGQTIEYNFNKQFLFEESTKKVKSISANFGNKVDYTIYQNNQFNYQKLSINYQNSGYKELVFTITFQDGSIKVTKGKILVKIPNMNAMRLDPLVETVTSFQSTIPFQGYDETAPIYGELDYRIFYHTNNGNTQRTLLKPIVIIDGFDPGDKRKIQDSDPHSFPTDDKHLSIEEMMVYFNSNNELIPLIPELRALGFDVIIVNHPTYERGTKTIDGGADYIERNVMNHVSLYQHLNNTLLTNGSSEELVIVGPSMGGQISRYALAYMEKNNIDHNVRLWVSVDSPHLGANIPLGTQSIIHLLDTYTNSVGAADFYYNQLKSTAAKQQLIEQHTIDQTLNYLNGGSPVYQQYYNNLRSNGLPNSEGYPQNLRKIALVNGSMTGKEVGIAGEEDFRIHGFIDHVAGGTVKVMEMNTKYMPGTSGTKEVARLWRLSKPTRTVTYTNNNLNGSMDIVPGGLFNAEDQIHGEATEQGINIWDDIYGFGNGVNFGDIAIGGLGTLLGFTGAHLESRTNKEVHSFIPTVSALGFANSNFKWSHRIDPWLLCNDDIPFDTFFAPKDNEPHTSFTETSVNWLLEELAGNEQSTPNYANPTMYGDPEVYVGQTVTYSIPRVAKATSYIWTLDFNYNDNNSNYTPWTIISGQGTNSITVRAGSPVAGVISCKPSNSCAIGSMTYKYVRSYDSTGGGDGGDDDPCDDIYRLTVSPNPNSGNQVKIRLVLRPDYPIDPCDNNNLPTRQYIQNTVEIYDMFGNKKYAQIYTSDEININNLRLKTGVYVVHLTTENGIKVEKKLMIE